jgi:dual 3',5'-cyclic-AMP and -GMP phosphodiesterase 11
MFETYLQFVGIAITNAQIMEASREEYERNRVIFCENSTKYLT